MYSFNFSVIVLSCYTYAVLFWLMIVGISNIHWTVLHLIQLCNLFVLTLNCLSTLKIDDTNMFLEQQTCLWHLNWSKTEHWAPVLWILWIMLFCALESNFGICLLFFSSWKDIQKAAVDSKANSFIKMQWQHDEQTSIIVFYS